MTSEKGKDWRGEEMVPCFILIKLPYYNLKKTEQEVCKTSAVRSQSQEEHNMVNRDYD